MSSTAWVFVVTLCLALGYMFYMKLKLNLYRDIVEDADKFSVPPMLIVQSIRDKLNEDEMDEMIKAYHEYIAEEVKKDKPMNKIGFSIE